MMRENGARWATLGWISKLSKKGKGKGRPSRNRSQMAYNSGVAFRFPRFGEKNCVEKISKRFSSQTTLHLKDIESTFLT